MRKIKPKVLVIVGPTASGKSALAVRLAKKFNGEIISADSRQVYKGLNIGTGKITKKEMGCIPHHLINVVDLRKRFNVSDYKKLAEEKVRYIVQKDKLPIVVGGTGFYIDALTGRINLPDVAPNRILREKLAKKSVEELFDILKKKDLRRADYIDSKNKVRLIRALEIVEAIGHVPLNCGRQASTEFVFIGLKPDNLDIRIYKRLIRRLEPMIREGKKLHAKGLTYKRMYELGLEYRYIGMYLQSQITKKEMVNKLFIEIKRYAKRQMTWFSAKGGSASPGGGKRRARNKKIKWFKPTEFKNIEKYIKSQL